MGKQLGTSTQLYAATRSTKRIDEMGYCRDVLVEDITQELYWPAVANASSKHIWPSLETTERPHKARCRFSPSIAIRPTIFLAHCLPPLSG